MTAKDTSAHAQGTTTVPSKTTRVEAIAIQKDQHKTICRRRKTREKHRRIQSILDAARKVMTAKGYLKATMDEIAMAAEITKPTIYLYFKNKDDLLLTLVQPLMDDIQNRLEVLHAKLLSGKIKDGGILMTHIFRVIYCGYESSPEAVRMFQVFQQRMLFGKPEPEIRSSLNDRHRICFDLVCGLLVKGIEMGLIRNVNVLAMTDVIWGVTIGVIQLEDFKADGEKSCRLKKNTLGLARRLMVEALTPDREKYQNTHRKK